MRKRKGGTVHDSMEKNFISKCHREPEALYRVEAKVALKWVQDGGCLDGIVGHKTVEVRLNFERSAAIKRCGYAGGDD